MEQNNLNIEDKIKVIHIKDSGKDENGIYFYIGRIYNSNKKNTKFIYLNGLANPFAINKLAENQTIERNRVINEFREYARQKYIQQGEIKQSVEIIAERLLNLNDNQTIYLVCFCKPLPCHGDLIREAVIKIANSK